jgi:hypothetical protein
MEKHFLELCRAVENVSGVVVVHKTPGCPEMYDSIKLGQKLERRLMNREALMTRLDNREAADRELIENFLWIKPVIDR